MKICNKCQEQFKTYIKIDGKYHNIASRKFCLKCSPYGQHNTSNLASPIVISGKKQCSKCLVSFPNTSEFFYRRVRSRKDLSYYCKSCNTKIKVQQMRNVKSRCVTFLGGKCVICKYAKCEAAFDIHHRDPSKKEFAIAQSKSLKFSTIEKELKKCVLLCANCHREVHIGVAKLP